MDKNYGEEKNYLFKTTAEYLIQLVFTIDDR